MYQREALRELRQNQAKVAICTLIKTKYTGMCLTHYHLSRIQENLKEKKIESKREDESMQQFKSRIRQETKKVNRLLRMVCAMQ